MVRLSDYSPGPTPGRSLTAWAVELFATDCSGLLLERLRAAAGLTVGLGSRRCLVLAVWE